MDTKAVAVGSIWTMLSRVVTLLCGFAVTIALARTLGPVLFGLYSVVLSVLVWVEYTVSMGIPSVYRKIISEDLESMPAILRSIYRVSLPYCLIVTAIFSLLSPMIAAGMDDKRLVILLVVASLDIPFFGLYTTYLSLLNGRGKFLAQSLLVMFYSIARTVLIVAAALLGYGVFGALIANAAGSLCGMVLAYYLVQRFVRPDVAALGNAPLKDIRLRQRLTSYGIPYLTNFLIASILIHIDIWLVKAFTPDKETVNAVVGFYAIAYNLARIPFFLIGGISFTIFPAVSMATFQNRRLDAQKQIQQSLQLVMIVVLPMIAIILATAERIIEFLFSAAYLPAADTLKILFFGVSVFSVYLFFVTIIAAEDRQKISVLVSLLLLPIAIALHYFFIPEYGIEGAALATTAVSLLGAIITGLYVWHRFGALAQARNIARLLLANGGLYALSLWDGLYEMHLLIGFFVLSIVYGILLIVLRIVDFGLIRDMAIGFFRRKVAGSQQRS